MLLRHFLAGAAARTDRIGLPRFIQREFCVFLRCGLGIGVLLTARSRTEDAQSVCDAGAKNAKKTKKSLQEAGKAVSQYVHRLAGLRARKKLDGTLRTDFVHAGQAIEPDLRSLRAHVQCPPA